MTTDSFGKMRSFLDSFEYRVARTREELERSYELVYQEYIRQGYIDEHPSKMRFFVHNILPETTTFVAMIDDKVTATATVIPDSPLGLPMDELYKDEIDELRNKGKKTCEISMLAHSNELFDDNVSVMLNAKKMFLVFYLFKHLLDYIKTNLKLDYICIAVNPKHAGTYEYLYFKNLGDLKYYDKVNGAPAVGKYLDVHSVEKNCKESPSASIYKMFFTGNCDLSVFEHKFLFTLQDIVHFLALKIDVFKDFSMEKIRYIQECYSDYDFSDIFPLEQFSKNAC